MNLMRKLCFTANGQPTMLFWILLLATVAFFSAFLSGCMNCYYRAPWTRGEIRECYQATRTTASAVPVLAFPQMMSDNPYDYCWAPVNLLTVPLALVALCTVPVEAALDTVCLPVDYPLSRHRRKK